MNAFQSELLSPDARNQNLQYFYEIENSIVHWVTLLLGASVGSILFVFRFRAGGKAYGLCDRNKTKLKRTSSRAIICAHNLSNIPP